MPRNEKRLTAAAAAAAALDYRYCVLLLENDREAFAMGGGDENSIDGFSPFHPPFLFVIFMIYLFSLFVAVNRIVPICSSFPPAPPYSRLSMDSSESGEEMAQLTSRFRSRFWVGGGVVGPPS